ncbi:Hsp20/alpha crystallin family protein [Priestia megaterium]
MNHGKFKKWAETLQEENHTKFWEKIFDDDHEEKNDPEADASPQIVNEYRDYPLIDVYEWANQLLVVIEIPGAKRTDVELTMHENTLHISGSSLLTVKGANVLHKERREGTFQRSIILPPAVEEAPCHASFKDGLLHVKFDL